MPHEYSGNAAFLRGLTDSLTPVPLMTVADWADTYRILSRRAAGEAGRYRTSRTPYMRDVMENLSPSSPVERLVFMKAAQTGRRKLETTSLDS
jgi:phage terminase large subunit GpA-like protein